MTPQSVVLVGCGNIGFRHLQALCATSIPAHVTVVEPNLALHARIDAEIAAAASSPHDFSLVTALDSAPAAIDLAVVATTADVRRAAVEGLLDGRVVRVALLEKVLFQTVGDLDAVGDLLERESVAGYVNCGRRTFPGYRALRDDLGAERPIDVAVTGHQIGLASNAVHFLDLAEFLNDAAVTAVDAAGLQPGAVAGRRPGMIEVFGTITATLDNGARLTVRSDDTEPMRVEVAIGGDRTKVVVDEIARTVTGRDGNPSPFQSQNVSETTEIYEDALTTGGCALTSYRDSSRQHRLYLTALRDHLGLSNADDAPCPVS